MKNEFSKRNYLLLLWAPNGSEQNHRNKIHFEADNNKQNQIGGAERYEAKTKKSRENYILCTQKHRKTHKKNSDNGKNDL